MAFILLGPGLPVPGDYNYRVPTQQELSVRQIYDAGYVIKMTVTAPGQLLEALKPVLRWVTVNLYSITTSQPIEF